MEERKKYETLDLIRIIASFFVVIVHVHFPRPYLHASMAIARFAVPVFFMISGFFLYSPADDKETALMRIRKTLKKILIITLAAIIFYFISNSAVSLIKGQDVLYWWFSKMTDNTLIEFIIFNRTDIFSSMIWYLPAFIYVLLILYLLVKYDKIKSAYILIPFLLLINLIVGEVLRLDWYYQGNWLLTGLPFVLTGRYLRDKESIARKTSCQLLWMMILAGTVITVTESFYFPGQLLYTGTILNSSALFILGIRSERKWLGFISTAGRKVTTYVFLLHCSIRDFIYALFGYPKGVMAFLMPFIVFVLAALTGYVIYLLKPKFKSVTLKPE